MRNGFCIKTSYGSEGAARRARNKGGAKADKYQPYRCPVCFQWHIKVIRAESTMAIARV